MGPPMRLRPTYLPRPFFLTGVLLEPQSSLCSSTAAFPLLGWGSGSWTKKKLCAYIYTIFVLRSKYCRRNRPRGAERTQNEMTRIKLARGVHSAWGLRAGVPCPPDDGSHGSMNHRIHPTTRFHSTLRYTNFCSHQVRVYHNCQYC
jgi:hypothetical protein